MKIVIWFVLVINELHGAKLPSYVKPCNLSDPNLNECARKHGQEALSSIVKGDNKYKIPNMTPLKISEMGFSTGNLNIQLNNVEIYGFENTLLKDMKVDIPNQHISLIVKIDRANLLSHYNINGRISILPIRGEGAANITFVGGEYKYSFDYILKTKKGEQYMQLLNEHLDYSTKRSYYGFENLFGGDNVLGSQMNQFLDEHWDQVEHDIGPALSEAINIIIRATISGIFNIVPMNQIFQP